MRQPPATVDALLSALLAARPPMTSDETTLARALYRQLAHGHPVAVADLCREIDQPEAWIDTTLTDWPGVFRDDEQAIIGFWGLTVTDLPPHRYEVNGVDLSTWCAFDTLFLTPILDVTAHVHSIDAQSGEPITLTITPADVERTSHPDLVMSFLEPAGNFERDIIERFCHYVHFFTDEATGSQWCAQHPGAYLLALPEAAALGRRYAAALANTTP